MSVTFKAGKYYVGDPCYVVRDHKVWVQLLDDTNYFQNENQTYKGRTIFAEGTAHGDGCFYDYEGREYGVDAGLIGIIPFEIIEGVGCGGQIIEFEKDFKVSADNGIFTFGDVVINTREDDSEEDNEDEDENDEEDSDDWEDEDDDDCCNDNEENAIKEFEKAISNSKPKCKLSGTYGNVFAIIGNVSNTLKRAGLKDQADEFSSKAFEQKNYQDVLALCFDYVDVR